MGLSNSSGMVHITIFGYLLRKLCTQCGTSHISGCFSQYRNDSPRSIGGESAGVNTYMSEVGDEANNLRVSPWDLVNGSNWAPVGAMKRYHQWPFQEPQLAPFQAAEVSSAGQ